ncbi:MAG: thioredoxin fold domain-containing protein [Ignavibacteriae bacterium]|nr:thioredoxin fold domain-containing protein [Ignavibacteriota bacterium]
MTPRTGRLTVALAALGFLLATAAPIRAVGDEPGWKPYARAVADAKENGRVVLVDVYTGWCGWCKKMDRDVYADARVRKYLAERYEIVKLDAEAATAHELDGRNMTERQIATDFGVSSYPTTLFLASDGTLITAVPGYVAADKFLDVLEYIAGGLYKTQSWNAFLEAKKRR